MALLSSKKLTLYRFIRHNLWLLLWHEIPRLLIFNYGLQIKKYYSCPCLQTLKGSGIGKEVLCLWGPDIRDPDLALNLYPDLGFIQGSGSVLLTVISIIILDPEPLERLNLISNLVRDPDPVSNPLSGYQRLVSRYL